MRLLLLCPYCNSKQEQQVYSIESLYFDKCKVCNHLLEAKHVIKETDIFGYNYKVKKQSTEKRDVFGYNEPWKKKKK